MKTVRILLDWTLDAKHAVLVEGRNKGFFKEVGIDLQIMQPESKSAAAVSRLYTGEAEMAVNYPHNIVLMQDEHPGIISVGSLVGSNPEGLLSLKEAGISSISDLKGKKIGVGPSPVSVAQLQLFLRLNGIPEDEVTMITVGFEGEELLLKGDIDALDAVSYAIPRTENKGHEVNFIPYIEYGLPDSPFLVFAASENWAKDHKDLLKGFFSAVRKGLEAVEAWTSSDWENYVKDLPERNAREEKQVWDRIHPAIANGKPFHLEHKGLSSLMKMLAEKGILKQDVDLDHFFPNTYLS